MLSWGQHPALIACFFHESSPSVTILSKEFSSQALTSGLRRNNCTEHKVTLTIFPIHDDQERQRPLLAGITRA
jgi:hypothetical protein